MNTSEHFILGRVIMFPSLEQFSMAGRKIKTQPTTY